MQEQFVIVAKPLEEMTRFLSSYDATCLGCMSELTVLTMVLAHTLFLDVRPVNPVNVSIRCKVVATRILLEL